MAQTNSDQLYRALRACRLWRSASDEGIRRLVARARLRRFAKGETVASEGAPAEWLAVVAEGTASVYHAAADGRLLAFESMGPGEPVLAVAALAGGRLPASVEAATDLAVAWLPRAAIFDLMAEEPQVARDIVTDLARRVVRLTGTVQMLALDVPSRVAGWLFQRSLGSGRRTAAGIEIELGIPKRELAQALGTVPETLSRALAKLRTEGLIETRGSTIVVRDVGGLARRGAGYSEG
jgi:CRP/FNR family transcriptional regulator, dissimilatory nitrate respiration regulator